MVKNTQTSQGWSSENGSSLKELVKISSTQNESDLRAETKGQLVPPWPPVDGVGLKRWMQKLERQVWTEGRSKVWLREVAEHRGAGSTSYAPSFTYRKFMDPDLLIGPNPPLEEFRVQEAVYLCHFGQDTGLRASISWGQIFSWAVRKSCHCWPNGPLSCGVEPLD